jgi:hypothetical protein
MSNLHDSAGESTEPEPEPEAQSRVVEDGPSRLEFVDTDGDVTSYEVSTTDGRQPGLIVQ